MDVESLYIAYMDDIYRYLYSLTKQQREAEDLLQETFMKAHMSLLSQTIEDLKPWLFKVAYYTYIDHTRKQKRLVVTETIEQSHTRSPETIVMENMAFTNLLQLLDAIKPIEKQAILLCDVHQCTYAEAADILTLNINTLKSHLARGRQKMRTLIMKEEQ